MSRVKLAAAACSSCPYRQDVPSGIWDESEYRKLPLYDEPETAYQPPRAFFCHKQTGNLCAGWVGCHDMENSLGLRMAVSFGQISLETFEAAVAYESTDDLFDSGQEACDHGLAEIEAPSEEAVTIISKVVKLHQSLEIRNTGAQGSQ